VAAARLRPAVRLACKASALSLLVLVIVPLQMLALVTSRRGATGRVPRAFHRTFAQIVGLKVRVTGLPCSAGTTVYACNHLSYLDIFALGGLLPARFVAKQEMRAWPVVGWLASLQRTVFVSRSPRRAAGVVSDLDDALASGDALVLFPEGTTSAGTAVLPFKSSAFAACVAARVLVQPVTILLESVDGRELGPGSGPLRDRYAYHGDMHLAPHLRDFLRTSGACLGIRFHPPIDPRDWPDRKALAAEAWRQVARGLAVAPG